MPVAIKSLYDTLNDFYRQQVDDFIVAMANRQKKSFSRADGDVDLDFLVSDSHSAEHFPVPKKWTREELYDRGF